MASKTVTRKYVDGTQETLLRKKQGRHKILKEFLRPCRVIGSVSQSRRDKLDEIISSGVLKESDIINHALDMWFCYYTKLTVQ
jgi:hypothetical protein